MALRVSLVPALRNAICAFCSPAPVGSVTVPVNPPVDADCAYAANELSTKRRHTPRPSMLEVRAAVGRRLSPRVRWRHGEIDATGNRYIAPSRILRRTQTVKADIFARDPFPDVRWTAAKRYPVAFARAEEPDRVSIHEHDILEVQDHRTARRFSGQQRGQLADVGRVEAAAD